MTFTHENQSLKVEPATASLSAITLIASYDSVAPQCEALSAGNRLMLIYQLVKASESSELLGPPRDLHRGFQSLRALLKSWESTKSAPELLAWRLKNR